MNLIQRYCRAISDYRYQALEKWMAGHGVGPGDLLSAGPLRPYAASRHQPPKRRSEGLAISKKHSQLESPSELPDTEAKVTSPAIAILLLFGRLRG